MEKNIAKNRLFFPSNTLTFLWAIDSKAHQEFRDRTQVNKDVLCESRDSKQLFRGHGQVTVIRPVKLCCYFQSNQTTRKRKASFGVKASESEDRATHLSYNKQELFDSYRGKQRDARIQIGLIEIYINSINAWKIECSDFIHVLACKQF